MPIARRAAVFVSCFTFVVALYCAAPAHAQMVPPDGWSQEVRPDGVMMLSPANERGDRAIYLMLRPRQPTANSNPG